MLISESTHRLTDGHFEYRNLGPVRLEGWADGVPAWQVMGASGVESRFEAQHKTRLTQLLGRDEEIDLLSRRWRQATEGDGCVVMLTGEPGIGKSHIALSLQERIRGEPHFRLRYFCSAHHTNSALFPFIGQLGRAARFERTDTPAQKFAKLESLLVESGADVKHAVPLLASLLSLPVDDRYSLR